MSQRRFRSLLPFAATATLAVVLLGACDSEDPAPGATPVPTVLPDTGAAPVDAGTSAPDPASSERESAGTASDSPDAEVVTPATPNSIATGDAATATAEAGDLGTQTPVPLIPSPEEISITEGLTVSDTVTRNEILTEPTPVPSGAGGGPDEAVSVGTTITIIVQDPDGSVVSEVEINN